MKKKIKIKVEKQVKSEVMPEVMPKVEPEVKTEVEPEIKTEVEPEIKTEVKTEVEPKVEPEVMPEVEPEVEPEIKTEVEPEVKTDTKEVNEEIDIIIKPSNDEHKPKNSILKSKYKSKFRAKRFNSKKNRFELMKLSFEDDDTSVGWITCDKETFMESTAEDITETKMVAEFIKYNAINGILFDARDWCIAMYLDTINIDKDTISGNVINVKTKETYTYTIDENMYMKAKDYEGYYIPYERV
jgi:hypothetical protein